MDDLKIDALAAAGNLNAMMEVAESVRASQAATPEQRSQAQAARRSIMAVMKTPSEMKLQVAKMRYAKLIQMLVA